MSPSRRKPVTSSDLLKALEEARRRIANPAPWTCNVKCDRCNDVITVTSVEELLEVHEHGCPKCQELQG